MGWREQSFELDDAERFEVSCMVSTAQRLATMAGCSKSRRGVVIWRSDTREVLGRGANEPILGACDNSEACRKDCPRICVHAEQVAILDMMQRAPRAAVAMRLLHVKVNDDNFVVESGGPSCAECSKLVLLAGIERVYLLHDVGWRAYPAALFHRLTCEERGLYIPPVSRTHVPCSLPGCGCGGVTR